MPRSPKTFAVALSLSLSGCGAPSYDLFGAFFPAWMFCGLAGVASALAARATFVVTGLSSQIPHQLAICTAIGVIVATLVWLLFFEL